MIRKILLLVIGAVSLIAIVAPFTFLPPKPVDNPAKLKNTWVKKTAQQLRDEKPLHHVKLPDFASIANVQEKKRQFFNYIRPAVLSENDKLLNVRSSLNEMLTDISAGSELTGEQQRYLSKLVRRYKVTTHAEPAHQIRLLLNKVDIVPAELVLVQAANESAWGTSRFARIGLNFFGIWCYKPKCGIIPNGRDDGDSHEVEAFATVEQAVGKYFYNINTNQAYRAFRAIRANLREEEQPLTAEILASGLLEYSERGPDYVIEITSMIRHNRAYFGLPDVDYSDAVQSESGAVAP